jgi:hypothetical protein
MNLSAQMTTQQYPNRMWCLLTVVGSPSCVRETILTLYRLGFAEVGYWSPVQRAANPKQVMSVLIRRKRDRLKDNPRVISIPAQPE